MSNEIAEFRNQLTKLAEIGEYGGKCQGRPPHDIDWYEEEKRLDDRERVRAIKDTMRRIE